VFIPAGPGNEAADGNERQRTRQPPRALGLDPRGPDEGFPGWSPDPSLQGALPKLLLRAGTVFPPSAKSPCPGRARCFWG
jgi:hypothetical protein